MVYIESWNYVLFLANPVYVAIYNFSSNYVYFRRHGCYRQCTHMTDLPLAAHKSILYIVYDRLDI